MRCVVRGNTCVIFFLLVVKYSFSFHEDVDTYERKRCGVKLGCQHINIQRPPCGEGYVSRHVLSYTIVLFGTSCNGGHLEDINIFWHKINNNVAMYIPYCTNKLLCTVPISHSVSENRFEVEIRSTGEHLTPKYFHVLLRGKDPQPDPLNAVDKTLTGFVTKPTKTETIVIDATYAGTVKVPVSTPPNTTPQTVVASSVSPEFSFIQQLLSGVSQKMSKMNQKKSKKTKRDKENTSNHKLNLIAKKTNQKGNTVEYALAMTSSHTTVNNKTSTKQQKDKQFVFPIETFYPLAHVKFKGAVDAGHAKNPQLSSKTNGQNGMEKKHDVYTLQGTSHLQINVNGQHPNITKKSVGENPSHKTDSHISLNMPTDSHYGGSLHQRPYPVSTEEKDLLQTHDYQFDVRQDDPTFPTGSDHEPSYSEHHQPHYVSQYDPSNVHPDDHEFPTFPTESDHEPSYSEHHQPHYVSQYDPSNVHPDDYEFPTFSTGSDHEPSYSEHHQPHYVSQYDPSNVHPDDHEFPTFPTESDHEPSYSEHHQPHYVSQYDPSNVHPDDHDRYDAVPHDLTGTYDENEHVHHNVHETGHPDFEHSKQILDNNIMHGIETQYLQTLHYGDTKHTAEKTTPQNHTTETFIKNHTNLPYMEKQHEVQSANHTAHMKELTKKLFDSSADNQHENQEYTKSVKMLIVTSMTSIKEEINKILTSMATDEEHDKLKMQELVNSTLEASESRLSKICTEPIIRTLTLPTWAKWNSWGHCSLSCGTGGYKLRHRQCYSPTQRSCLGNDFDLSTCRNKPCPASWLQWGKWSKCSVTCGHGLRVRTRTCLTPDTSVHCHGATTEVKDCFDHECTVSPAIVTQQPLLMEPDKMLKPVVDTGLRTGPVESNTAWSEWTGWSKCTNCEVGSRHRKRMCLNYHGDVIHEQRCAGAKIQTEPCTGSACPFELQFPGAPRVSEGKTAQLQCPTKGHKNIQEIYWVTPTDHITRSSSKSRVHMYGSSLVVERTRYVDQGQYRCVIITAGNNQQIVASQLIVHTCKGRPCHNGGICEHLDDPEHAGLTHYVCRCQGSFVGAFCEEGFLRHNVYLIPVLIAVFFLVLGTVGLIIFLTRSKEKANSTVEKKHPPNIKRRTNKMPVSDGRGREDAANSSIVSNDDSFVEITENDFVDFDGFSLSQEEKRLSKGYASPSTSGGFKGSYLRSPSPPKQTRTEPSHNGNVSENHYMTMVSGHQKGNKFLRFEDEDPLYLPPASPKPHLFSSMPTEVSGFSNLPGPPYREDNVLGTRYTGPLNKDTMWQDADEARVGHDQAPSPAEIPRKSSSQGSSFSGSIPDKISDTMADMLIREHEYEVQREVLKSSLNDQRPRSNRAANSPFSQALVKSSPRDTKSPTTGREKSSPASKSKGSRPSISLMNKEQEVEFLKHFDPKYFPQTESPSTSTPKKLDKSNNYPDNMVPNFPPGHVIMPSDIIGHTNAGGSVRRNLSNDLLVVTSRNVIGIDSSVDISPGKGNRSSNNARLADIPEISEGEDVYFQSPHTLSGVNTSSRDSFQTINSSSPSRSRREINTSKSFQSGSEGNRSIPEMDSIITFPKMSHQQLLTSPATPLQSRAWLLKRLKEECQEGSVNLSDCHYTPCSTDLGEASENQTSSCQASDDERSTTESSSQEGAVAQNIPRLPPEETGSDASRDNSDTSSQ